VVTARLDPLAHGAFATTLAVIVNALGAGSLAFVRIDIAPLSLARLCGSETPESRGAGPLGSPVVTGTLVALMAAAHCMLAASPSHAHRISTRSGPPPQGISIPSLTHGQMMAIRDNLPVILALHERQDRVRSYGMAVGGLPEPSVSRLSLGIVPGSVTDEGSPLLTLRS
jgi:hypothetical protein